MTVNPQPSASLAQRSLWSVFLPLLPFMLSVFDGFLAMGMALPVLPRHVHDVLGQGTVMVGVVMGCQYASSLFGRMWAGGLSDARGPRRAALCGLATACAVGLLYLASAPLALSSPALSLGLLMVGRLLTGIAESFLVTGTMAWALARVGTMHAGKVFGWIGVALFGGLAIGAPIGTALNAQFGLAGVACAVLAAGLVGLAGTSFIAAAPPSLHARLPFFDVLNALKLPGLGLTLCCVGYAMINTFAVLLFVQRGWEGGAFALTSMGAGFIAARLLVGHLPDVVGGARVALYCVLAEAVGLALIWAAPHPALAWLGAALTGAGYGIGFQGFGVEAVKRSPPQSRGAAMGAYVLFQDITMGIAPPLNGWLARVAGLDAVFLGGAVGALGAALVAALILRQRG
ncbi:arabinose transporter [Ramlibacter alkalitolerans]|uniref:Arabinose transporter n=1 Tax=Ramlibacter alkalitolerans TaxID=2039631 RepID=A0ABS1JN10_9BURK|nr:arabinose transporter [Ramlibacter alkalitolerans]MBL0425637.1 arabinose transporter [Ramlibacter alkalitolerans]